MTTPIQRHRVTTRVTALPQEHRADWSPYAAGYEGIGADLDEQERERLAAMRIVVVGWLLFLAAAAFTLLVAVPWLINTFWTRS